MDLQEKRMKTCILRVIENSFLDNILRKALNVQPQPLYEVSSLAIFF
jgi:hypothetical protein